MARRADLLDFAVLGLLHESPMHGYELRKRLNTALGAFRALSYGSLYPCLRELLATGWVRETPGGPYLKSESSSKITITITGDSLHFYQGTNFWYKAKFTLPTGPDPQQLHATIIGSAEGTNSIGQVIIAFYKMEDGTLTLGGIRDQGSTAAWPKSFEAAEDTMTGRYELRKAPSQTKNNELPKSK